MFTYMGNEIEILQNNCHIEWKEEKTPKVSVIIPVYNVEKYIAQALDSVINQTLKEIEIIVIDDCSPDNSMRIAENYAKNDNRFVLLYQENNQGQGIARNRALELARGEYIMFLDPDDWYEPDACERAYEQISKNQNEIVFFNYFSHKEKRGVLGGARIGKKRLEPFESVKENPHINLQEFDANWFIASWTVMQIYSKNFLNKNHIRYSKERFTEDIPFFIKACINAKDVSILDLPLYHYRKKVNNTVINYSEYYTSVLSAKEEARKIIIESGKKDLFWKNFILYEIGSNTLHFKNFTKINKKIRKEFYKRIKERFEAISLELGEESLKKSHAFGDYSLILKSKSFEEYKLRRFFKKLVDKSSR